jgi:hypothetical protein
MAMMLQAAFLPSFLSWIVNLDVVSHGRKSDATTGKYVRFL